MPRKSLHGRTCGVSREGGRARALQPSTDQPLYDRAIARTTTSKDRPSRLVLARSPSRDLTRHGCRVRAYRDVLAACPARVGGQGPCSQAADHPLYN
ncbi:hypothetical protein XarbCFBP7604_17975 [Xanthomonas arboricola]|nr:hypothetical protein XarbCFBP7604_17975 [Xanthomonas arboricola]